MRQLEYPTYHEYPGPWLIDFKQLEALDNILDEEWKRLIEYKESMIQEKVEKELQDVPEEKMAQARKAEERYARVYLTHYSEGKQVKIVFKSGKRLIASSFKEAARDKSTRDELPKSFHVFMACGKVEASLSMKAYGDRDLELRVEPSSSSVATEVFSVLERWVQSVSAPLWQRLWLKLQGMQWGISCALVALFGIVVLMSYFDPGMKYQNIVKPEIRELLKDGISEEETNRVLEIILVLQTKIYPENLPATPLRNVKVYALLLGILLSLTLVSSFPPTIHLGIGIGERRLKSRRFYLKVLSITIPGIILTGLVLPFIYDKIYDKITGLF